MRKSAAAKRKAGADDKADANGPAAAGKKRGRAPKQAATAPAPAPARKRGRPAKTDSAPAKRAKLDFPTGGRAGVILSLGTGDTGQLGLGEDILDRTKPAVVKMEDEDAKVAFRDVCAGGMHSVGISEEGTVYTFGCNDEGALGRPTPDDEACFRAAPVQLPGGPAKVVQASAGDSHTVVLDEDGRAFYWGTFRDSSGSFGLTERGVEMLPIPLAPHLHIKKVASGSEHIALLTSDGQLYTLGCGEQGQLGRINERFAARGGRRGLALLHKPELVHAKNRRIVFTDVWAGSYSTYALTNKNEVLVCGLNNYNQLGIEKGQLFHNLVKSDSFSRLSLDCGGWRVIAPGQHHALALDGQQRVHVIGRVEYGRLGLGEQGAKDAQEPTLLTKGLPSGQKVCDVSCGTAVSFAVAEDGSVYSWGMGTNGQLGHQDDEDAWTPGRMLGKQLETRQVVGVSGGGQHTILLAVEKK